MEEIHAEVEAAKLAAEQVTPENVKAFLATLPEDVFGRGLVAMYDTACKATSQMKPLLNTIVPGRELTEEGVAKLKEGIDTRMKGVAFRFAKEVCFVLMFFQCARLHPSCLGHTQQTIFVVT